MVVALGLALGLSAKAGTITFEGIPLQYRGVSGLNLGDYYDGVTFGPTATAFESNEYNSTLLPPHSGTAILFAGLTNDFIRAVFDAPVDSVSVWCSGIHGLTLEAYNSADQIIDTMTGPANTSTTSQLSVTNASSAIAYIIVRDPNGIPNSYNIDDLSSPGVSGAIRPIPEPSTIALVGLSLLSIIGMQWRKRQ